MNSRILEPAMQHHGGAVADFRSNILQSTWTFHHIVTHEVPDGVVADAIRGAVACCRWDCDVTNETKFRRCCGLNSPVYGHCLGELQARAKVEIAYVERWLLGQRG